MEKSIRQYVIMVLSTFFLTLFSTLADAETIEPFIKRSEGLVCIPEWNSDIRQTIVSNTATGMNSKLVFDAKAALDAWAEKNKLLFSSIALKVPESPQQCFANITTDLSKFIANPGPTASFGYLAIPSDGKPSTEDDEWRAAVLGFEKNFPPSGEMLILDQGL